MIVNIQQAKIDLGKYIEKALAGEEIILSKSGKPVGALVPLARTNKKTQPVIFAILTEKITSQTLLTMRCRMTFANDFMLPIYETCYSTLK